MQVETGFDEGDIDLEAAKGFTRELVCEPFLDGKKSPQHDFERFRRRLLGWSGPQINSMESLKNWRSWSICSDSLR
jgi:hypothetical protein